MENKEVARYWNENADDWTEFTREGYDTYRDAINTPGMLALLPDVAGLNGLDIGCGEGHNTRLAADKGAKMTGIDISDVFIRHAIAEEKRYSRGIEYVTADACELPFGDDSFDFAVSFMCFMDTPSIDRAFSEAYRVLKSGGFLQFSILHPCFILPYKQNIRDNHGLVRAIEIGGYFDGGEDIDEWTFSAIPEERKEGVRKFRIPCFYRTLSEWVNTLTGAGFTIEAMGEPHPDDETVRRYPSVQDAQVTAYFLHIRGRK
ncbi:MAG: methyltransferase domain-containing protein [Brevinematales bacterium]|nr:methyltransferase domain-containing protein [Brevinematales bacterium]